jgi:hypothetical protein
MTERKKTMAPPQKMEEEKLGHAALVEDGLLHRRIHHLTEEKQRSKIARFLSRKNMGVWIQEFEDTVTMMRRFPRSVVL